MPAIQEVATITSKGQITLPKPIRQALGVSLGDKVAFDLRGTQVIVTRVENAVHEDPAIGNFLVLLEQDIASGRHILSIPVTLPESAVTFTGIRTYPRYSMNWRDPCWWPSNSQSI
jgi:antitoxin PrlF